LTDHRRPNHEAHAALLSSEKIGLSDSTSTEDGKGDGREEKDIKPPESFPTAPGFRSKNGTMRIGIREQLALLVLLTSMVALAVISIATVRLSN
jgi:hypothetical protein